MIDEEIEELQLIKDLLTSKGYRFEDKFSFYDDNQVKRDFMHYTVYVPNKDNFIFLIGFDIPFTGYRFSRGKQYDEPFNKDINEIEEEVKKYGRRKV